MVSAVVGDRTPDADRGGWAPLTLQQSLDAYIERPIELGSANTPLALTQRPRPKPGESQSPFYLPESS